MSLSHPRRVSLALWTLLVLAPSSAYARQDSLLVTPPTNVVLPNPNGEPLGPYGGLEAGAYVARVDDPTATWFNPAGLSRATTTEISGSAGSYQLTTVSPTALPNRGGSFQQVPSIFAFSFQFKDNWTVGFALLTNISWSQETDAQLVHGTAIDGERFGYSSSADYSQRQLAIAAGHKAGGAWRYGAGVSIAYSDLSLLGTVSDRLASPTSIRTILANDRRSGFGYFLRGLGGVQYDRSEHVHIGALVRTPTISVWRSGFISFDSALQNAGGSTGASLYDDNATFDLRTPWEFHGAVAYIRKRGQVEVDVQGYAPVSQYTLLGTSQPYAIYRDPGIGTPPVIETHPFAGFSSSGRGFGNVAIGAHFKPITMRNLLLHFGFATDTSPVTPDDMVFDQVNLHSWTVGASGAWRKLQYSVGFNARGGTTDNVRVRDLLSGERLTTSLDVKSVGLVYSLSYAF